jgi:formylglycine-generating enzyme required for sulfatase activity
MTLSDDEGSDSQKITATLARMAPKKMEEGAPARKEKEGRDLSQAETMYIKEDNLVEKKGSTDKALTPTPEVPQPRPDPVKEKAPARQLVNNLEQNVARMKKHTTWKRTAAFFVFLLAGLSGFWGYQHRGEVNDVIEKWTRRQPVHPVIPGEIYQIGQAASEYRQQFENEIKSLQPAVASPDLSNMASIPAATFNMGSLAGEMDEEIHAVALDPYYLDRCEVSNRDYAEFCKATGYSQPPGWPASGLPVEQSGLPVVHVSYYDATRYAQWQAKRLPTEAEWEHAMKGSQGHEYPWGNQFLSGYANVNSGRMDSVMSFPKGKSQYGNFNMVGNVWEWTSTPYGELKENFVIKGGSFAYPASCARASYHDAFFPHGRRGDLGFRCAWSPAK